MGLASRDNVTDPTEEFILTPGIELSDCPRCRRTLIAGERCPNGCAERRSSSHGAALLADSRLEPDIEAFARLAERAVEGRLRGLALA